jgi:hypothetical protein
VSPPVGSGELTPGEGAEISRLIEGYIKTLEVTEHEERLTAIEAAIAGKAAAP